MSKKKERNGIPCFVGLLSSYSFMTAMSPSNREMTFVFLVLTLCAMPYALCDFLSKAGRDRRRIPLLPAAPALERREGRASMWRGASRLKSGKIGTGIKTRRVGTGTAGL